MQNSFDKFFYLFCLMILFYTSLFAGEIHTRSGQIITYQSIVDVNSSGVTVETQESRQFLSWTDIKSEDAYQISPDFYEKYLESVSNSKTEKVTVKNRLYSYALDELLLQEKNMWKNDKISILKYFKDLELMWISDKKTSARSIHPELTFLDQKVYEALFQFKGEKLSDIYLSIYNRGDAGDIDMEHFNGIVQNAKVNLEKWTKTKGTLQKQVVKNANIHTQHQIWTKNPYRLDLEWSSSTYSDTLPEYIRLRMAPFKADFNPLTANLEIKDNQRSLSLFELQKNVVKEANGNVYINAIPMVDQGSKGYCSVATSQRILQYYGKDIDQHELAQIAQTETQKGTYSEYLVDGIHRIAKAFDVKVKTYYSIDYDGFTKLIGKYNKLAKAKHLGPVSVSRKEAIDDIYQRFEINVLKEVCQSNKSDFDNFQSLVIGHVEAGIPLLWSVVIGPVRENPPILSHGGHMRIIFGFNPKTHDIIYTDSWGIGHEFKKMNVLDAWAITKGLYSIEPQNYQYSVNRTATKSQI